MQKIVFVSFSNKDSMFADEILSELRTIFGSARVEAWTETSISTNDNWETAIHGALHNSLAAILFISPDYLSSNYVRKYAITKHLKSAEDDGVIIRLVSVYESSFDLFGLSQFIFLNEPSKELIKLGVENRKRLWLKLIDELREAPSDIQTDELQPEDQAEIDGLLAALRSRFPGKPEEEILEIYKMVTETTARHIGAKDKMASSRKISDSEIDITPLDIDGLDQ